MSLSSLLCTLGFRRGAELSSAFILLSPPCKWAFKSKFTTLNFFGQHQGRLIRLLQFCLWLPNIFHTSQLFSFAKKEEKFCVWNLAKQKGTNKQIGGVWSNKLATVSIMNCSEYVNRQSWRVWVNENAQEYLFFSEDQNESPMYRN